MLQQLKYLFLSILVLGIWGNLETILRIRMEDEGKMFSLAVVIFIQLILGYLAYFKEKQKVVGIIIFLITICLTVFLLLGLILIRVWNG